MVVGNGSELREGKAVTAWTPEVRQTVFQEQEGMRSQGIGVWASNHTRYVFCGVRNNAFDARRVTAKEN